MSFCTVIAEALVVELSMMEDIEISTTNNTDNNQQINISNKDNNDLSKSYVSNFFLYKNVGLFLASFLKGIFVEFIGIRYTFLITSIVPISICLTGIFLNEEKLEITNTNYYSMSKQTYFHEFFAFIMQKKILLPSLFIVLILSMPSYSDPMFYFTTNALHFTPSQIGLISVFSYLGTISAVVSYKYYFKSATFKSLMIGGDLLYFVFSFCTYCLVKRYSN